MFSLPLSLISSSSPFNAGNEGKCQGLWMCWCCGGLVWLALNLRIILGAQMWAPLFNVDFTSCVCLGWAPLRDRLQRLIMSDLVVNGDGQFSAHLMSSVLYWDNPLLQAIWSVIELNWIESLRSPPTKAANEWFRCSYPWTSASWIGDHKVHNTYSLPAALRLVNQPNQIE